MVCILIVGSERRMDFGVAGVYVCMPNRHLVLESEVIAQETCKMRKKGKEADQ